MQEYPRVAIGILAWNQKQDTLECLDSVEKIDYPRFDVVVIDNGSTDQTCEAIKQKFPKVKVVRNEINLGCAEGVNCEIRYALQSDAKYLLILANDAVIDSSALKELIKVAESDTSIGLVAPKVYYYDNPQKIWFAAGGAKFDWKRGKFYGHIQNVFDNGTSNVPKEFDYSPGGFSLVRIDVLRKGCFLDPRYFIFFDDSDWNIRIKKLGYKMVYCPEAKAWHKASSSLGMESPYFYYYRTRNRLLFIRKNASSAEFFLFLAYFIYDFIYNQLLTLCLQKRIPQLRASVIGLLDFCRANFGKRDLSEKLLHCPLYKNIAIKLQNDFLKVASAYFRTFKIFLKSIFNIKLKILVILNWNLGDEIMAIPVYEAIKKKYPKSLLGVKVRYPELLYGNPYIDTINIEVSGIDMIIDLRGEDKTKNRLDYLEKRNRLVLSNRIPQIYLENGSVDQITVIPNALKNKVTIGISTGTNWRTRKWSIDNFKKVAEYFIKNYDIQIIELGKDCEYLGLGINLINKTSVIEVAKILKQCDIFIGNDSGLIHLSLAVNTPTVGLFGPLIPERLISEENKPFLPLRASIKCQGCWSKGEMQYPDCCPKLFPNCMDSIRPEKVIETAELLLKSRNKI